MRRIRKTKRQNQKIKSIILAGVLILAFYLAYFYRTPILNFFQKEASEKKEPKTELQLQEEVGEIVKTKDFNQCQKVDDELYRTVCINNIALELAKETQDISYCQKIDNKLIPIDDCERQVIFQKSIDKEDIKICLETKNQELQKQCQENFYPRLALKKENISICSQIQEKEKQDFCYNYYLVTKNFSQNPKDFDCSLLKGSDAQEDCQKIEEMPQKPLGARPGIMPGLNNSCSQLKTTLFLTYCL